MLEARGPGQERCLLTSSVLNGQQYLGQCGCPFRGCNVSLLSSCSLPYESLESISAHCSAERMAVSALALKLEES